MLAASYWREVEATTRRLCGRRCCRRHRCSLFGRGPVLIRLGRPAVSADPTSVTCTYPIVDRFLVSRPAGRSRLSSMSGRSALHDGYVPLAGRSIFRCGSLLPDQRRLARLGRDADEVASLARPPIGRSAAGFGALADVVALSRRDGRARSDWLRAAGTQSPASGIDVATTRASLGRVTSRARSRAAGPRRLGGPGLALIYWAARDDSPELSTPSVATRDREESPLVPSR